MVVTARPSACSASRVQDFTDSPSSNTVHAPHEVESQPTLVPVRPTTSRRYCTNRVRASISCSVDAPLTTTFTLAVVLGTDMRPTLPGVGAGSSGGRRHPSGDARQLHCDVERVA